MSDMERTGSCLCGSVKFEVTLSEKEVHVCHCSICQRWAGGPGFAIKVEPDWKIEGEDKLTWYASSEHAKRGFCGTCGSHLLFRTNDGSYHGVTALLENLDDLKVGEHIFIDTRPDFYKFADGAPQLTEHEFLKKIGVIE